MALQQLQPSQGALLAEAMPTQWSEFVRSAPMDTVRPLGTRAAPPQQQQRYGAQQTYTSGSATAILYPPPPQQQGPPPTPGKQPDF